jgi:Tol biopolymer transport system component
VMNPDGTNPTRLTHLFSDSVADLGIDWYPEENFLFAPAWSPDGTGVAFERVACVGNIAPPHRWGGIYVMSADGSGVNRLTPDPRLMEERHQRDPVWSADGTTIAFSECWVQGGIDHGDGFDIWGMDPDGTDQYVLIAHESGWGSYSEPAYSPDGLRIAYAANPEFPLQMHVCLPDIAVANADGTDPELLDISIPENLIAHYPTWSPDGTKIAFQVRYVLAETDYEICVVDADGTDLQRLTENDFNDEFPAWSPDGAKIAFASDRDGDYEIYVMNADGSSPVNLTNDPSCEDKSAAWGGSGH